MISGNLPSLLGCLLSALSPLAIGASTPEHLLASLARPAPATTAFVEIRYSDLLSEPLLSRGMLSFDAADQLSKRVDEPFQESTVVRGEAVRVERSGRKPMHFSLKRAPELRALLVGFSALLSGDQAALRRHFEVAVSGEFGDWQILLSPIDARIAKRIRSITVLGADAAPRCFLVDQADGDSSLMLVDVAAAEALPENIAVESLLAHCRRKAG